MCRWLTQKLCEQQLYLYRIFRFNRYRPVRMIGETRKMWRKRLKRDVLRFSPALAKWMCKRICCILRQNELSCMDRRVDLIYSSPVYTLQCRYLCHLTECHHWYTEPVVCDASVLRSNAQYHFPFQHQWRAAFDWIALDLDEECTWEIYSKNVGTLKRFWRVAIEPDPEHAGHWRRKNWLQPRLHNL